MKKKICAVIVTYNRPELLCRNVEHLLSQDYPLDILIYDNHSTQNTKKALESKYLLKENVTYYYADSNSGGSGGFHNGMKMAVEKDYDAVWLMDDDGYPVYPNTLSKVIEAWEKLGTWKCIVNSFVVCDPEQLILSFPLDRESDGNILKQRASEGLLKDWISPFNGTLVPVPLIKEIGYPIKEFFVYGDETEYTLRAQKHGAVLYSAVESVYFHPTLVCREKKIFGRKFTFSNCPLWKTYCAARNSMFYMKKYCSWSARIKRIIRIYMECIWMPNNRGAAMKEATRGIRDGMKGDFTRKLDLSK